MRLFPPVKKATNVLVLGKMYTNLMQKTRFLRRHCEKTLKDRDLKFLRSSSSIQKTKTAKFQVSN